MTSPPTIRWSPPTGSPPISTIPRFRIIDASFKMPGVLPLPSDDYLGAHIPGAVFFDVNAIADRSDPRPHMYPDAEQFARDVGALGISSDDTVVAYDSGAWVAAPRAWWMFLSFGHRDVKVLDGGLKKWLREGRPTHSGKVTPKPGEVPGPRSIRASSAASNSCSRNLDTQAEQVVDARPQPRFEGTCRRALAGPPPRSHPRQPQRALCRAVRRRRPAR